METVLRKLIKEREDWVNRVSKKSLIDIFLPICINGLLLALFFIVWFYTPNKEEIFNKIFLFFA